MKKHSSKAKINKKKVFNRLGMTYVELLCALSLLMLIVVMFTPMLLSSYETVYKAGERVESAYNSKEELEDTLATRLEENLLTINDFGLGRNATKALYNVEITGKKIVSSLTKGLETVFGVARARVNIVSPSIVYDDQDNHNVIIQVKGLDYNNVTFGEYGEPNATTDGSLKGKDGTLKKGTIHIEVIIPQKTGGNPSENDAYNTNGLLAKVKVKTGIENNEIVYGEPTEDVTFSHSKDNGRIYLNISSNSETSLDFTQSPVRIRVYYVDNRDKIKYTSAYLTIKPPSMIFAGEANDSVDYYTSAGVVEKNGVYKLEVNPRKMRLANSGALKDGTDNPNKAGTTINTVAWIDADNNPKLQPYYVMAGTNSRIYRMYNYNVGGNLKDVFPQSNISISDTTDKAIVLTDGSVATQSFWSGDISDQYYFRTEEKAAGYGTEKDNSTDCSRETVYNAFDTKLRYLMAFSGMRTAYDYRMQASRRMSYVLTEAGAYSFRIGGKKQKKEEFTGYTAIWEPDNDNYRYIGPGETHTPGWEIFGNPQWDVGDRNQRVTAGTVGSPNDRALYFTVDSDARDGHYESNLAYISAISYTSIPVHNLAFDANAGSLFNRFYGVTSSGDNSGYFWGNKGSDDDLKSKNKGKGGTIENYLQTDYATSVDIKSAVYLPDSSSRAGEGQVIYFGSVPAYSLVRQSSDIGKKDRYMYNDKNARESRCTLYYILSDGSNGAYVSKYASASENHIGKVSDYMKWHIWNIFHQDQETNASVLSAQYGKWQGVVSPLDSAGELFTRANEDKSYFYHDPDLQFTFGYCSRWRMTLGSVTSDGSDEATKSYERFYIDSQYAAKGSDYMDFYFRKPAEGMNNGGEDNMFYNVWFPGEHYTLTHTATCDEVTVACGYTVSGSSFMEESSAITDGELAAPGFYGTALGSVYNDGVLAAYVSEEAGGTVFRNGEYSKSGKEIKLAGKGEQNVIFQNVLYYKSPKFSDRTLHSRKSVRFTAVDLYTVTPDSSNSNNDSGAATVADIDVNKEYYAVYGDSTGRAFYSKIATSEVSYNQVTDTAKETVNLCTEEDAVPAKEITTFENGANGMCEIKVKYDGQIVSLSKIFSAINTVDIENDIMIITGTHTESVPGEQIVIGTRDDDSSNNWTFILVKNGNFEDTISGSKIVGGYYYICGNNGGNLNWIAAVSLDALRELEDGDTISNAHPTDTTRSYKSTNRNDLLWVSTPTKVYAFDGRDTKG